MGCVRSAVAALFLALLGGLLFTGCGPIADPPLRGAPGVLASARSLWWLGVDFRGALFSDPYFDYDDLVLSKIPSWNRRAMEEARAVPLPVRPDLALTRARNEGIVAGQVKPYPAPARVRKLSDALLAEEVAPYVDRSKPGPALLLVVQAAVKDVGLVSHSVVFERSDGTVLVVDRHITKPSGVGVHNYYLNAIKRAVNEALASVSYAWSTTGE